MRLLPPAIFLLTTISLAFAQPSTTPVQDTIYTQTGATFTGKLTVQLSTPAGVSGGKPILSPMFTRNISNGVLNVSLVANDLMTPAGTEYIFNFSSQVLNQSAFGTSMTCIVPTSVSPVKLANICTFNSPSSPSPSIPLSWINLGGYPNGTYCWQVTNGIGTLVNSGCPGGSGGGSITIAGTSVPLGGSTVSFPSPGPIGGTSPSTGAFTTLSASGQIISTIGTGTSPLVVSSTTQVINLNASLLSGNPVGTSGASVPLLSSANAWSALQTFGTNISIGGVQPSGATGNGNIVFSNNPTLTGSITMTAPLISNITGTVQCAQFSSLGQLSGTGVPCGSGSGGANANGYYLVSQSTSAPANAINLGALTSGFLYGTVSSGINTISSVGSTGTGNVVLANSPTLVTPALGTPSAAILTNATGTASGLTAGLSLNLSGGSAGSLPYQSAANTTSFVPPNSTGSTDEVLTSTSISGSYSSTSLKNAPSLSAANFINFPILNQNTTGNAATATNWASYPALCGAGQFSQGYSIGPLNNCATPPGGGNVSTSGSPAQFQVTVWVNGTAITGVGPGGLNLPLLGQGAAYPAFATIAYPTSMVAGHLVYASSSTQLADMGTAFTFSGSTLTGSSSAILNLSALSSTSGLEVPLAAGAVPTSDGFLAFNSTTHALVHGANGTTIVMAAAGIGTSSSTTCTNQFIQSISAIAAPTCASVSNADLSNSSITIAGTSVALGGATVSFPSPGPIGGTTPGTGAFTTISATGQITSTIFTGTAPFVVSSTTLVANLQAATAANLTTYPTLCSGGQFSTGLSSGSNNCVTPSGGGNVSTGGTASANQIAEFLTSTSIGGSSSLIFDPTSTGGFVATLPTSTFATAPSATITAGSTTSASGVGGSITLQAGTTASSTSANFGNIYLNVGPGSGGYGNVIVAHGNILIGGNAALYNSGPAGTPLSITLTNGSGLPLNGLVAGTSTGQIIYWNGSAWVGLAGNSSGTNYLQENASGVPSWSAPSASVLWSGIGNPVANLTLSMAGYTTTFNQTSPVVWAWANTTAAIVSASSSSPVHELLGTEWTGSSVSGGIGLQFIPGTGVNAPSTFAITHIGSATGFMTTSHPGPISAIGLLTLASNGTNPSAIQLAGNSTAQSTVSNSVGLLGPNSASFTGYDLQFPSTAPSVSSVIQVSAPSSGVSQLSYVTNLTLGASGTAGSITLGNATSGLITIQPVTGALGTVTISVPAITDTLVTLTAAQTLTNKNISASEITSGTLALARGGTAASLTAALGSIVYSGSSALALLAGNVTATDEVLVSHGTGSAAQAPTLTNAPALSAANMTGIPGGCGGLTAYEIAFGDGSGNCAGSTRFVYNPNGFTVAQPAYGLYISTIGSTSSTFASTAPSIFIGSSTSTAGTGGTIYIAAGNGSGSTSGGIIELSPGIGSGGSGTPANVQVDNGSIYFSNTSLYPADSTYHCMVVLNGILSASANGACGSLTGSSLTIGDVYYQSSSGLALAEANSSSTLPAVCLAISSTVCVFSGEYTFGSSQGWSSGSALYVSDGTAGALTSTAPSTSGHFVQKFGIAISSTTLLILPSLDVAGIM